MTASAGPALKRLHDRLGERIAFVTLYVREAHPGDRYPQPETFERKLEHARDYREREGLPWPVAVDEIDGALHQQLDPKPNAAYAMDIRGRVAFRTLWSNDREAPLARALGEVADGKSPVGERSARMFPMNRGLAWMDDILGQSGPVARRDVLRQAPPMYAIARAIGAVRKVAGGSRSPASR